MQSSRPVGVETPPPAPQRGTFLSSLYSPLPLTILMVTVFPAFLRPSHQKQDHSVQEAACCRDRPTIGKAGFQTHPAKLAAYSVGSGLLSVKWGSSQTQSAWISEKSHGWLQITCCSDHPPPPKPDPVACLPGFGRSPPPPTSSPLPPQDRSSPRLLANMVNCPRANLHSPLTCLPWEERGMWGLCPIGRNSWIGNRKICYFLSCQHSREMISIFCDCSLREKNC